MVSRVILRVDFSLARHSDRKYPTPFYDRNHQRVVGVGANDIIVIIITVTFVRIPKRLPRIDNVRTETTIRYGFKSNRRQTPDTRAVFNRSRSSGACVRACAYTVKIRSSVLLVLLLLLLLLLEYSAQALWGAVRRWCKTR